MKKAFRPQWFLIALTLIAALVGVLVRSSQLKTELLPEGRLAAGASLHIVLLVLTLVTIGGFIGLLLPLKNQKIGKAVFSSNPICGLILFLSAACLLVANGIFWLRGPKQEAMIMTQSPKLSAFLSRLLPPLGILAAICIAAFAVVCLLKKTPSPSLYMVVSLYLTIRLIICFQAWNADPSIHDYAFQLLAAICAMLASLQLAGFGFDMGRRRLTLFWCLCTVVFCSISLPDAFLRNTVDEFLTVLSLLMFGAVNGAQLLFCQEAAPELPEES